MKDAAVIDSSSLIFAFKIEKLWDLLKSRYSKVLLSKAVYTEVVKEGKKSGKKEARHIKEEISGGFLEVREVRDPINVGHLGRGELEVITLAYKQKLPAIMDDKKARAVGSSLNLRVLPISSFILWGIKQGLLNKREGEEILNSLIKRGYRLKSDTYIEILEIIKS